MALVAARAGVHTTTVSRALRDDPRLPLATRKRLRGLATEMGYQRDPALDALSGYRRHASRRNTRPVLAYLTAWNSPDGWRSHAAHRAFFEGARHRAAELGYQLENFWLREEDTAHHRMSRVLLAQGVTGVIFASPEKMAGAGIDFEWRQFCAVRVGFAPCSQQLHMVANDHRRIVALAVRRAISAGYRRIGFVTVSWSKSHVAREWAAGYLGEQQLLGRAVRIPIFYLAEPPLPESQMLTSGQGLPLGQLSAWIRSYRPDVILGCGSFVRAPLAELGLSIPRDVAFVDTSLEKPDGATAGVHHNHHRVGAVAVEIVAGQLQNRLRGLPAVPMATLVQGTWHDGASLPRQRDMPIAPPAGIISPSNPSYLRTVRCQPAI